MKGKARQCAQQTNLEVKKRRVGCALCRIASDSHAPTALKWRPISLLDRGVKMHAYLNERAFREVKDGQYSANRCFVPGATPWQHLSFFGLFMRWVWHLLALADAGSAMRGEGCRSKRFLFQTSQSRGCCTICDSIHPKPELPFSPMLFPEGLLSCLRRQRLLMIPGLKGLPIKSAEINQGGE